ncbi:MAG TPA: pitrilysin family protein [Pyrinomonadaceae bacterium]|nr:pitrilysin family protein [Pyrinomonadaceae bacterium]
MDRMDRIKTAEVSNLTRALSLALALTFALSPAALARQQEVQTPRQSAPEIVKPTQTTAQTPAPSSAEADAAASVAEFDVNGMKVLVKRRAGSQTVAAGLFLRGGVRNVTAENAGIEALMLDAATEASQNFPRERMRRELARMGTAISYGVNYDFSALTLGSTRANFDRSWEIFIDGALRPTFATEDVERVRNRLVTSLRDDADTPDSHLAQLQSRVAYAGHPYINNPRGTVETVSRITVADLRRYHAQIMQTSRLLLVVVGDLDPQVFRRRATAAFGKLPRGNYRPSPLPQLSFAAPTLDVTERALETNYVQGVFAAPALTSEDIYPMRIASSILQNRVITEVRYRRSLSYAPDAFLYSQGANVGGIYVTTDDVNQSVSVMLAEIARIQRDPVTEEELRSTVQHYLTRHYLGQETNAAQAGNLAQYELLGGGWRNSFTFLDRLRAVTPDDVRRVSQTYMRNMRFVVLGDPRRVDKTIFLPPTTAGE